MSTQTDTCRHNWTTPPECPACCADERDELRDKLAVAVKALKQVYEEAEGPNSMRIAREALAATPCTKP